jgi:hypothetical protein
LKQTPALQEVYVKKLVISLAVLSGFLVGSGPLFAHHGTGTSYDLHKVIVLKGVVTQFNFANPHSQLYFDVTDEQGKLIHWSAEMRNPHSLESYGYTKRVLLEKFVAGASVTVTGNISKAGTPVLLFGKAVTTDGWCLCDHAGGPGSDAPGVVGQGRG